MQDPHQQPGQLGPTQKGMAPSYLLKSRKLSRQELTIKRIGPFKPHGVLDLAPMPNLKIE